jgi:hypothetical protein
MATKDSCIPLAVLGFETDAPETFLDLVMELRESEARPKPLRDCLDDLG